MKIRHIIQFCTWYMYISNILIHHITIYIIHHIYMYTYIAYICMCIYIYIYICKYRNIAQTKICFNIFVLTTHTQILYLNQYIYIYIYICINICIYIYSINIEYSRSYERNFMKKYKTKLINYNMKVRHVLDLSYDIID